MALATGCCVRGRGAPIGARLRAGWPVASRPNIPSWTPGSWPRSRKTRPRRRAGWASCSPPSSAKPSTTAAPTTGTKRSPPGRSAARNWPMRRRSGFLIAVLVALASQARSQAEPRTVDPVASQRRPTSRSIRAIPRSNAARRSWSSPVSRAACRPTRASSSTTSPDRPRRRGMTRSLEDPTFAGRVESVETDLAYRVEFEGKSTRHVSGPRVRISRARAHRRQAGLPAVHVARAEDRRGHPARHGRRGDRADVALPAQQGRRHGPAGRRGGPGDRADAATRTATMSTGDLDARRPAAVQRPAGRPGRAHQQAGRPRSWSTSRGTVRRSSR